MEVSADRKRRWDGEIARTKRGLKKSGVDDIREVAYKQ